ncbi:Cation-transporting P-type ATPase [Yersinia aldovae ATCC 35236]|nr:Cation-transporting P-type ATPase [Yersinia aldovae ATCC 35236]
MQHLNSSEEGLSQQEAKERLKQYGPNALPAKKSKASTAAILSPF